VFDAQLLATTIVQTLSGLSSKNARGNLTTVEYNLGVKTGKLSSSNKPLELHPPLVALLTASNLVDGIASGEKHNTVRERHRDYQPGTNVVLSCPDANWCVVRKIGACIVWILPGLLLSRRCCNSRMTPVVLTEYLILQTVLANHTRPNEKKMPAGTKAHSGNFLQTREGGRATSTP
jgi:hypothetical protein